MQWQTYLIIDAVDIDRRGVCVARHIARVMREVERGVSGDARHREWVPATSAGSLSPRDWYLESVCKEREEGEKREGGTKAHYKGFRLKET